ncbi:MAG: hypothetical protein GXP63_01090 [DPANN group archaeon]|nr:hypothetical protein [DPANN group archaeon]
MTEDFPAEEGEENVYKKETREDLVENDELSPEEEAFMKGYDEEPAKDSSAEKDDHKDAHADDQ